MNDHKTPLLTWVPACACGVDCRPLSVPDEMPVCSGCGRAFVLVANTVLDAEADARAKLRADLHAAAETIETQAMTVVNLRAELRREKKTLAEVTASLHERRKVGEKNATLSADNARLRMALREARAAIVEACERYEDLMEQEREAGPALLEHGPMEVHPDGPHVLAYRYPVLTRIDVVLGEEPK